MMLGLERGIKASAHRAANAAQAAVRGTMDTGARSGNAALAQSFAASILPRGWSFPALLSLWNQESGWSAYAVNKSSGAYGIPQSLGHGHPYNLGDYKAQVMWGINYIAGRYGNSQNAWAHEQAFNWYGSGLSGGIFNRPTLIGVGERGPERVDITPAGSPGRSVVINMTNYISSDVDADLVARKLAFVLDN
jgi:SLT domain-containing protein